MIRDYFCNSVTIHFETDIKPLANPEARLVVNNTTNYSGNFKFTFKGLFGIFYDWINQDLDPLEYL